MKSLSRLNSYLIKYKKHLLWGTLFVILSNLLSIYPAQIVRIAFDLIKENISIYRLFQNTQIEGSYQQVMALFLGFFGLLIIILALLRGLFMYFMRQTLIVMSRRIENDLKNDIFSHLQTLSVEFFRKKNTGDIMARISEDVSRVRMYLGPAIMYSINLFFMFLLVIFSMVKVNANLTLIVLIPLPFLAVLMYLINHKINKRSEEIQSAVSDLSTFTQEAFSGIRILKSFSREDNSRYRFGTLNKDYFKKTMGLTRINAWYFPLLVLLVGLSTILTIFVGGKGVLDGSVTTGNIAEFVIYVNMLAWPVTSLGWVTSLIQRAGVSQRRINELLDQRNELDNHCAYLPTPPNAGTFIHTQTAIPISTTGKISFKNVSFSYKDSGRRALSAITFELAAKKTLGITGSIGSGKSTVAGLLCRLFDPTEGEILIGDMPLKNMNINFIRNSIGYVPQDVFLFSDTIYNNIAFGSESATSEKIIEVSQQAGIYDTIMSFSKGFETEIGERGITLSGGQKQRVAIARALLRQPHFLILDDCLSAVDTKTENHILENLGGFIKNRTTLIISHRVSSLKFADKIIVLEEGKIVEEGEFEELLKKEGLFFQLYESQLKDNSGTKE